LKWTGFGDLGTFLAVKIKYMPLYRVSIKRSTHLNGVSISKGLSVDIPMFTNINPVVVDSGSIVNDAFMRVYGIDLKKLNLLNTNWLEAMVVG
jgi:hypothetical protein